MKKIMSQIRGENIGRGGKNFFSKALPPPQGKSEMAPLSYAYIMRSDTYIFFLALFFHGSSNHL